MQWAYLFERFPSFTQTFCYREVAEIMRQGLAPWIFSIRRPRDEPGQDFPAELAGRVRYLPEDERPFHRIPLADPLPARCIRACRRWRSGLKNTHDYARMQEAGWLGGQMQTAGIGHVHAHFAGLAARTAYWLQRYYGIGYSFTAHANDIFCPPDPDLPVPLDELIRRREVRRDGQRLQRRAAAEAFSAGRAARFTASTTASTPVRSPAPTRRGTRRASYRSAATSRKRGLPI